MEHRTLGRTGMYVSPLCLGAMMFGDWGNKDHDESVRIIHRALDAGINFIDTADVYARGESEEIVGKALKDRRDDVILATKVHGTMGDDPNQFGNSRRWIAKECDASLKRLGTDWIDLYQIHRPELDTDIDETLGALTDLVRAGKVRAIGSSTFPPSQIVEAQWTAERRGRERFVCEQPPYSLLVREVEREVLPVCQRYGMGVIPWSPLAGGYLSGRYRRGAEPPKSSRAERLPHRFDLSIPENQRKFDAAVALGELADDAGLTLIELALAFVIRHPAVTAAIIGPRTMEHLESQLTAADVTLSDDVLDRIDEIVPPGLNVNPVDAGWSNPAPGAGGASQVTRRVGLSSASDPAGLSAADGAAPSPGGRRAPIMIRMRPILHRFGSDLGYQLSTLPASILAFAVVVAGISVAAAAIGVIVGLPLLLGIFAVVRWNARLERARASWALKAPVPEAYRRRTGNWLRRLRVVAGDPQSWKDLAWLAFVGTFGFVSAVVVVTMWGTIAGLLVLPAWYWSLPNDGVDFGLFRADTLGEAFLGVDIGLVAIPLAFILQRWMTEGLLRLSKALLSPSREAALEARVGQLAATRAGAVDAAAAELQRIERDLHDGAQARLVALAMDLGMAEERFERDPEGARELVGEAREEAKRALAELRDLARGIRPSLLAERGLAPALTALAARSPIPASVDLDVPSGLPDAVETTTWFVVSEALVNAAKHSGAARVLVSVGSVDDDLIVEISDDGLGGAKAEGSGLTGLRKRVEALDGTLAVTSPSGGPTTIRAELPCAS